MGDKVSGFLEVGVPDGTNDIVVNVPVCEVKDGFWNIVFSPAQARNLAQLLVKHAEVIERRTGLSRN